MKHSLLKIILIGLLSPALYAHGKCFYLNVGAGADVPHHNLLSGQNSYPVLYTPTVPGTSLFQLPNVEWKDDLDPGFAVDVAVGYRFSPHIKGELEFIYQNIERNGQGTFDYLETATSTLAVYNQQGNNLMTHASNRAQVYSLFTNGIYDFKTVFGLIPSIGAGFGVSWLRSSSTDAFNVLNVFDPHTQLINPAFNIETSPTLTGTAFSWQLKAALSYPMKHHTRLSFQYRLFGTTRFVATTSDIRTNPGTPGDSIFTVPQTSTSSLLNSLFEVILSFDV